MSRAAVMIVASAAIIGCFSMAARAEAPPHERDAPGTAKAAVVKMTDVDRWAELAAAHEPDACARCRSRPEATTSVADVLRRMRHEAASRVSTPVGPADITADLKHVAAAPADDQVRQAMRIADEVARGDVRKAASFAAALPAGHVQNGAMLVVIYIWSLRDRQAALDWAQALPDERTRGVALHEVTRHLVAAGAHDSVALVSALAEGPGRDDALCSIAQRWAKIDRAAALTWARGLDESPTKARILSSPGFELAPVETVPE